MINNLDKLTIIINSCDKYEDCWLPFFKLFNKFGCDLKNCKMILNTETKIFKYENLNIHCLALYKKDQDIPWGKRLRDTIDHVNTDYILMLLDDFFLHREVDIKVINNCIEWLDKNENTGMFNLLYLKGAETESKDFNGFCLIPTGTAFRLNAQAGIWKKEILKKSILDMESPWEWERFGNMRNDIVIKQEVYSLKKDAYEPYFYNYYPAVISGIMRGKWAVSHIDPLFKKYGIFIDYSIRGEYIQKPPHISWYKKLLKRLKENNVIFYIIIKYSTLPLIFIRRTIIDINEISKIEKKKKILVYPYIFSGKN